MRLLVLLLACVSLAWSASTTVSGTVTDASGNNLDGTAYISWPSFIEPDGELVVAGQLTSTITNGALSVALAPNTGSTPSGTSYSVRIVSDDRQYQGRETWVVPNTGTATLSVVRTADPPTPSATISLSALSISGVSVGDIMTVQSGPVWARLAAGSEGEVLTISSGVPAWGTAGAPTDAQYWLSAADGDLSAEVVVNNLATLESAIAAYDFSDASNLDTGDLAAARMQTNVGAALGAGLTNGKIPFIEGGAVVTNGTGPAAISVGGADRLWVDTSGEINIQTGARLRFKGGFAHPHFQEFADDLYLNVDTGQSFIFREVSNAKMTIGGSQTAKIQDETATTGDTLFNIWGGAGETGALQQWGGSDEVADATMDEDGALNVTNVAVNINNSGGNGNEAHGIFQSGTGTAAYHVERPGVYEYSWGFPGSSSTNFALSVGFPGQAGKTGLVYSGGSGVVYIDGGDANPSTNPVFTATNTAVGVGSNNTSPDGDWSCRDNTATTGDTLCVMRGGPADTGNVFEIQNNAGTTTAGITEDGKAAVTALDINDGGTRPSCDSSERGTMWFDEGGAGVKDDLSVCAKDAGDAYAWRSIY